MTAPPNFTVRFYQDQAASSPVGNPVVITIEKNKTSALKTLSRSDTTYADIFNTLDIYSLYLYEIDDNGLPITDSVNSDDNVYRDKTGEAKYTVSYSSSSKDNANRIVGGKDGFGNYIGTIQREVNTTVEPNYFGEKGFQTYLGSDYVDDKFSGQNNTSLKIYHENRTDSITLKDYTSISKNPKEFIHNLSSKDFEQITGLNRNLGANGYFAKESVSLADAKRGRRQNASDFNVINLISKYGDLKRDLEEYAGYSRIDDDNGGAIQDLLKDSEKNDEYLLINIDASKFSSYTLQQMRIDGEHADSDYGYPRIGSHIIFNFVQKAEGGEFKPYTGEVTINNVTAGLIFAPMATFNQGGGLRGGVIAEKVIRPEGKPEIHQKLIGSSLKRYITFQIYNHEYPRVKLGVTKQLTGREWKAGDQFKFTLSAQDKDTPLPMNKEVIITQDIKSNSFGEIAYTKAGTYQYKISEIPGNENGMTYAEPQTVTVTVTEHDGKLTAQVDQNGGQVTFINKFVPESTAPEPSTTESESSKKESESSTTAPESSKKESKPSTTESESSTTAPETSPTTPETSPVETTAPETSPVETTTSSHHEHHDHDDKPTPGPTTTAPDTTTAAETTTVAETTTKTETTVPGHEHSEDITGPDGSVMGAGRNRNRKSGTTDDGEVAGMNRQVKTGDISMMRLYAVGVISAIALLIGWFISWKKKQR